MDILSLPDAFLAKLMRKMEIKDRLRLRLTSRAFEKLVATSHAGYFDGAELKTLTGDKDRTKADLCLSIGILNTANLSCDESEQFINIIDRLFDDIHFGSFSLIVDSSISMDFINRLTETFTIDKLSCTIETNEELEIPLLLMEKFATSRKVVDISFRPDNGDLLSLPPLEELKISSPPHFSVASCEKYDASSEISSELFFMLLSKHKNIYLDNIDLTTEEWIRMLQIFSTDPRNRLMQLGANRSTVERWLTDCGIREDTEAGETIGEFEVMCALETHLLIELKYRKCNIQIVRFQWMTGDFPVLVEVMNEWS